MHSIIDAAKQQGGNNMQGGRGGSTPGSERKAKKFCCRPFLWFFLWGTSKERTCPVFGAGQYQVGELFNHKWLKAFGVQVNHATVAEGMVFGKQLP